MNEQHLQILLEKYLWKKATAEEKLELFAAIRLNEKLFASLVEKIEIDFNQKEQIGADSRKQIIDAIFFATSKVVREDEVDQAPPTLTADLQSADTTPVHRINFLRTAWLRYAAALLIILGAATFIYVLNKDEKPSVATNKNPVPVQNDVAPGGNKATLTLADGSKIILDSAKSGELAREANATITKTADGKIVYEPDVKVGMKIQLNTMSTPRGGQYQLALPDGSQVWLNAESSITYPTAFAGNERKVSITGEAYFEVTKNKAKPFKVDIGTATIEVLGTHFNINTYKEEPTINTTLIEGSVRLTPHASRLTTSVHASLILKPGQQGQLKDHQLFLAAKPNIEQVMAWKNGLFNFNNASLEQVMRQIERWYDLNVVYDGKISPKKFGGEIQRDLNLSEVLEVLKEAGVRFTIEGKKLVVHPY